MPHLSPRALEQLLGFKRRLQNVLPLPARLDDVQHLGIAERVAEELVVVAPERAVAAVGRLVNATGGVAQLQFLAVDVPYQQDSSRDGVIAGAEDEAAEGLVKVVPVEVGSGPRRGGVIHEGEPRHRRQMIVPVVAPIASGAAHRAVL